jgi:hypothetical protein
LIVNHQFVHYTYDSQVEAGAVTMTFVRFLIVTMSLPLCIAWTEAEAMQVKTVSTGSGLADLSNWRSTKVLVSTDGGSVDSSLEERDALATLFQADGAGPTQILEAVRHPRSGGTVVLGGAEIVWFASSSVVGVSLAFGTVRFHRSIWTSEKGLGFEAALKEFAASSAAADLGRRAATDTSVNFGGALPEDFFVRGSGVMAATVLAREIKGADLRIRLQSYAGVRATLRIDLERKTVQAEVER